MATSYVEYRGRGFWSYDPYLEHSLALLADVSEADREQPQDDAWLAEARAHWLAQASGRFAAHMHPRLDDFVTTVARRDLLLRLLEVVSARSDATTEVRQTITLLARLLRGELDTDASNPLDYMVSGDLAYEWRA